MSMLELIERIEKEKDRVIKFVEGVKNIPTEGRSAYLYDTIDIEIDELLDKLVELGTLKYSAGMLAGFNVVLQIMIELDKGVEA